MNARFGKQNPRQPSLEGFDEWNCPEFFIFKLKKSVF